MADGKRPGPGNPIRTSLVDSGWDDAPGRSAPPVALPARRPAAESVTEEVDELLDEIDAPSALGAAAPPEPVRVAPVVGIGGSAGSRRRSMGDEELFERALGGDLMQPSKPPPPVYQAPPRSGAPDPRARQQLPSEDPLPRFDRDDSVAGARLPAFGREEEPVAYVPSRAPTPRPPSAAPPSMRPPQARSAPPPAAGLPPLRGIPASVAPSAPASSAPPRSVPPVAPRSAPPPAVAPLRAPVAAPSFELAGPDIFAIGALPDKQARRVSVWLVVVVVVFSVAGGASGAFFALQSPRLRSFLRVSPSASAVATPVAAPPARAAQPADSANASPVSMALVDRAARGDEQALSEIEGRPATERTAEEATALASGRVAVRLRAARELRDKILRDPKLAEDPATIKSLREQAADPETAREALSAIASLPGSLGPDLLHELWTKTTKRTVTTELAEALLFSKDVRPKASPALAVALDLRRAESCEESQKLLPNAIEVADRRALGPLVKLTGKRGCGPKKLDDCYACLGKREQVTDAIRAARDRKEPKI